ncbi:MAG: lipopolysaccharide heptosyltransferase I [Phycisphaerae bacterium]|nr:lipopolysaccharide heptosyltransferase I [Phycisphaerae bacterium]
MNRHIRRILIIKPSALGDVVHGLPVLHGLRTAYPDAHIAWMIRPAYADVIRGHRELDEIIDFDRKHFGRMLWSWRSARDFCLWVGDLARRKFDLVVDLQGLLRTGIFSWFSLARRRIGPANARECSWLFYNQRVRSAPGVVHAVDRNYLFAVPLGFDSVPPTFELPIGQPARDSVRARLMDAGLPPGRPFAVLAPGASYESKRWPADRFARVAEHLADRGITPVLSGAPNEAAIAAQVRQASRAPLVDLVGRTNVKEAMALLENATVVVSNDSGPMHLAAALGRPLVAIFGPTDPARTGPFRRPGSVVRAVNDTSHNYRHSDTTAICAVTVEMALATLDRELQDAKISR